MLKKKINNCYSFSCVWGFFFLVFVCYLFFYFLFFKAIESHWRGAKEPHMAPQPQVLYPWVEAT